jgi:hypothetical protein
MPVRITGRTYEIQRRETGALNRNIAALGSIMLPINPQSNQECSLVRLLPAHDSNNPPATYKSQSATLMKPRYEFI